MQAFAAGLQLLPKLMNALSRYPESVRNDLEGRAAAAHADDDAETAAVLGQPGFRRLVSVGT